MDMTLLFLCIAVKDYTENISLRELSFDAFSSRQCLVIEILDDQVVEGNETFSVHLSTSDSAVRSFTQGSTVVHIIDNDGMKINNSYIEFPVYHFMLPFCRMCSCIETTY